MNDIAKKLERQGTGYNSILWVCRPFTYPVGGGGCAQSCTSPTPQNFGCKQKADMAETKASKECFFKGNGRAVVNIYGFEQWKHFFKANGREMTYAEADEIEASSDFENFNVEGTVTVEWPDVTLEFNMNKLLGKRTVFLMLVCPSVVQLQLQL